MNEEFRKSMPTEECKFHESFTRDMEEEHSKYLLTDEYKFLKSLSEQITKTIETIKPGERVQYDLPMKYVYNEEDKDIKWDIVEEIQMDIRGYIPKDVFTTIRFDKEFTYIMIDIYHV